MNTTQRHLYLLQLQSSPKSIWVTPPHHGQRGYLEFRNKDLNSNADSFLPSSFFSFGKRLQASSRQVSKSSRGFPVNTRSSRHGRSASFMNSTHSLTTLFEMYRTFSFFSTLIPFSFSILLYEIHNCSNVSPTASNPFRFLMLFLPRDRTFKFSWKINHQSRNYVVNI